MKKILIIGCTILSLAACQKQTKQNANTISNPTKKTRFSGVYSVLSNGNNTYQFCQTWGGYFSTTPNSFNFDPVSNGTLLFANTGSPVENITGLAYDYAGSCFVLYRSGPGVDWEIGKFSNSDPSAVTPFATLNNTATLTDLGYLEYNEPIKHFI